MKSSSIDDRFCPRPRTILRKGAMTRSATQIASNISIVILIRLHEFRRVRVLTKSFAVPLRLSELHTISLMMILSTKPRDLNVREVQYYCFACQITCLQNSVKLLNSGRPLRCNPSFWHHLFHRLLRGCSVKTDYFNFRISWRSNKEIRDLCVELRPYGLDFRSIEPAA